MTADTAPGVDVQSKAKIFIYCSCGEMAFTDRLKRPSKRASPNRSPTAANRIPSIKGSHVR
jgi:hypothetical protein